MNIRIILLALTIVSASSAAYLLKVVGGLETKLDNQISINTALTQKYSEQQDKLNMIQANMLDDEREIQKIRQQASKDLARVESVAIKKARLYEKLVNKDFEKSQNELVIISE